MSIYGAPLLSRMRSGLCFEEGTKAMKCNTGSLETLDAGVNQLTACRGTTSNIHNVHCAELTKTVRSSGIKPYCVLSASCNSRGSNARGPWYCT